MYRLAAIHSVTDRQTDRQHYHVNSQSYCMQYEQQKLHKYKCNRSTKIC